MRYTCVLGDEVPSYDMYASLRSVGGHKVVHACVRKTSVCHCGAPKRVPRLHVIYIA